MRKKVFLYSTLVLVNLLTITQADEKIGLEIDSQFGSVKQESFFVKKVGTTDRYRQKALVNSGSLKFKYDKKNEIGLRSGAYIKLNANTSESSSGSKFIASDIKLYIENKFGKIEFGNTSSASSALEVGAESPARAAGGLKGGWQHWLVHSGILNTKVNKEIYGAYLTAPQLPIGYEDSTKSGKINYFSPRVYGFTFNCSYTPDSKQKGTVHQAKGVLQSTDGGYHNVLQQAIRYEKYFDNGFKFTTSILSQIAQAKQISYFDVIEDINKSNIKVQHSDRESLKALQIGTSINYMGLSLLAEYGNSGKSGALVSEKSHNTYGNRIGSTYWYISSVYSIERYGLSIDYMQSKKATGFCKFKNAKNEYQYVKFSEGSFNEFEATSFGIDYALMPGLLTYIEATKFKFKENDNHTNVSNYNDRRGVSNKGIIILTGTKIKF